MNSKKTFITLGIVVAVLALGIAYAAVNQRTLNVVGNITAAETDDANFVVGFDTETAVATSTGTGTVSGAYVDENNATMTVSGLTTEGQEVTATYTVKNSSTVGISAKLSADVTGVEEKWYEVTASWGANGDTIAKDGNTTLIVKVKLIKTPVTVEDVADAAAAFNVTLTATPQGNA